MPGPSLVPGVQDPRNAKCQARRHRWGLVPSWAKEPTIGNHLINAQAETPATQPAFQEAFNKRRLLISADGFYKWEKENRHKRPFDVLLRDATVRLRRNLRRSLWGTGRERDVAR